MLRLTLVDHVSGAGVSVMAKLRQALGLDKGGERVKVVVPKGDRWVKNPPYEKTSKSTAAAWAIIMIYLL